MRKKTILTVCLTMSVVLVANAQRGKLLRDFFVALVATLAADEVSSAIKENRTTYFSGHDMSFSNARITAHMGGSDSYLNVSFDRLMNTTGKEMKIKVKAWALDRSYAYGKEVNGICLGEYSYANTLGPDEYYYNDIDIYLDRSQIAHADVLGYEQISLLVYEVYPNGECFLVQGYVNANKMYDYDANTFVSR